MTTLLAFSETEALDAVLSGVSNITTGNAIEAGVNRAAIQLVNQAVALATLDTPQNEGWVHAKVVPRNGSSISGSLADYFMAIVDGNNNIIAGFYQNNTSNGASIQWRAVYFLDPLIGTGGNEPTTGLLIGTPTGGAFDVDIHYRIADADGFIRWYVNGSLVREVLGDTQNGASTVISKVRFRALGTSAGTTAPHWLQFSQVIVSDEPTIGARLHTLELSAGSVNEWAGTIADVTGVADSPLTFIQETTIGDEILFAATDIAAINSGNEIKSLVLSQSALAVPGAPVTNLRGRVRVGGTTYDGATKGLTSGFAKTQHFFELNPATSAKWTLAQANGAELGMEAVA